MHYQVNDPSFEDFVDIQRSPEQLCTGLRWAEGPVWFQETETLLFSDITNCRMMQWSAMDGTSEFLCPSEFTNGHFRDLDGHLVSCEQGGRRVVRRYDNGSVEVIADSYNGVRLNSPNDLIVKSDGSIWFTDSHYGIDSDVEGYEGECEYGGCYVLRVAPGSGELSVVADDFDKPNGLAFSPGEDVLYIADGGAIEGGINPAFDDDAPHHIRAFDVVDGCSLTNGRLFVDLAPGVPDGFRVDSAGFVWTSVADGVHCYSASGELYGKILLPEVVSNLTFGGMDGTTMFITATSSVYAVATTRKDATSRRSFPARSYGQTMRDVSEF